MDGNVVDGVERRRAPRHASLDGHGITSVHVRPGRGAILINISSDGALIETAHRLLPGARVELLLERSHYRASIRGHVLRASIVRLDPSVCFRGAIGFDRSLPWFVEPEGLKAIPQVV